jgi:cell division initiation protein
MEIGSTDIQQKNFRRRVMGYDPKEVDILIQQTTEDIQRLKAENAGLQREIQERDKELKEFREREKTIRNVLVNTQKAVEQMKLNAEKEAKLIVAEAEMKAEKISQSAHQRLAQLHGDIAELKNYRVQMETRIRTTILAYQQLLDMDKDDNRDNETEKKVKLLSR